MKRILVMGLPGSGKTNMANALNSVLKCPWFSADLVREQFNDWDFSYDGRIRQAHRMRELVDSCPNDPVCVIADFIAPLPEMRDIFDADITIWMDTLKVGRFEDTNKMFIAPTKYDYRITDWNNNDKVVFNLMERINV